MSDLAEFDEKLARLAAKLPDRSLTALSFALKAHRDVDAAYDSLQPRSKKDTRHGPTASSSGKPQSPAAAGVGTLDGWMSASSHAGGQHSKKRRKSATQKEVRSDAHQVVNLVSDEEEEQEDQPEPESPNMGPLPHKHQPRSPDRASGPSSAPSDNAMKPSVNDVLRPQRQDPGQPKETGPPPLLLGTPELVAQHTPCTLILNVLPSELAMACFLDMLQESCDWQQNRWNIFDRDVVSPHTTRFYYDLNEPHLQRAGSYWFNHEGNAPKPFTAAINQVREVLQPLVNQHIYLRDRLPYEWAGPWRANVTAANCYAGSKESVGFHSDRLNYLGPQTTIASLSLGVTRLFRLRSQGPEARTLDIRLPHNCLLIMHAGCQEMFKHSIPPQRTIDLFTPRISPEAAKRVGKAVSHGRTGFKERINITFRFYRPDFTPEATQGYPPLPRCKCEGQPLCVLRPDMKGTLAPDASTPYFWQCGGPGSSCGFFQILDMTGRGPCIGDSQ